jgi:DNA-binding transcriptional LysR family regulator
MDTLKLKHFCAVVDTQSLSRAAELMGISHAGLHKSLKTLEEILGVPLTEPKGRGIGITSQGMNLYPLAKEILSKVEGLIEATKSFDNSTIRLGSTEPLSLSLPQKVLSQVSRADLSISFHERCPGDLEAHVASKYLSFGLTTLPVSSSGIEHLRLSDLSFGLFSARKLNFQDDLTFIRPTSVIDFKERDHWREDLFPRKNSLKVNMISTGLDLAAHGHGAIFIPKILAANINERSEQKYKLNEILLPKDLRVTPSVFLVKRVSEPLSKPMEQILGVIKKLCS